MLNPVRHFRVPLRFVAIAGFASALLYGCAYNASGVPLPPTLIFEYSLAGGITQSNNLAYYFVLNTSTDPSQAPQVNGPAPLTYPYPDPRNYLPFVRDQSDVLDRQPIAVPPTYWTDYFALYQEGGQMVMWQGRKNTDGTINERYRQLQQNNDWGLLDNEQTIQIKIPLDQITEAVGVATSAADPHPIPKILEGNLAVATRNYNGTAPTGYLIDRWGIGQNQSFTIDTSKTGTQDQYNTVAGVTFPANLGVVDPNSANIVALHYHVVVE